MLSVTTDYKADVGSPEPYLRRIADHGFTHVHWCHQWDTDFLYARSEVEQIAAWLSELGLGVTDLHASDGREKRWVSREEWAREAGVELVRNRIEMAARLGTDVIIMHMGRVPDEGPEAGIYWESLWRSLDALTPALRACGVRIALENGVFRHIRTVLDRYPADLVGLCYDCGHGNMSGDGLDETAALGDRLISLHLHDNNGGGDQHNPLFSGTVDWARLAGIIAGSGYGKWINMETTIHNSGFDDEDAFLAHVRAGGERLTAMVSAARG